MTIKTTKPEFLPETRMWVQRYKDAGVTHVIPVMDLDERLRILEERMLIIAPHGDEILDKYPTLKQAYKEYKVIEKLTLGGDNES